MPAKQAGGGSRRGEPDVAALGLELAERVERHHALRMLVVPPSGSMRSNSLKSTALPLASSLAARFLVAPSWLVARMAYRPLPARICAKSPPKEWPTIAGRRLSGSRYS